MIWLLLRLNLMDMCCGCSCMRVSNLPLCCGAKLTPLRLHCTGWIEQSEISQIPCWPGGNLWDCATHCWIRPHTRYTDFMGKKTLLMYMGDWIQMESQQMRSTDRKRSVEKWCHKISPVATLRFTMFMLMPLWMTVEWSRCWIAL